MNANSIREKAMQDEKRIQESVYEAIRNSEKIVFDAGAGAGKTFALIESLRFILDNFGDRLALNNQSVICITYTNAAVLEIRERLGHTDLVSVTTIHEKLWDLINRHQKELVQIHRENLDSEIDNLDNKLRTDPTFKVYQDLNNETQGLFEKIIQENIETYYKNYDKPAEPFRSALTTVFGQFPGVLKNVQNFRKIADAIIKREKYKKCILGIRRGEERYRKLEYTSQFNDDRLHQMKISHDTLLSYASKVFQRFELLQRIVIDKYPFILVDEYQDTNPLVIKILGLLHQYSDKSRTALFIGYFGDSAQSIYDDGIGNRLGNEHPGLKLIRKNYNRRSKSEIIEVINRIRGSEFNQESIFEDNSGGEVKFFTAHQISSDPAMAFIDKYKELWNATPEKPLHCLLLMNKKIAEFSGFGRFFICLSATDYYKRHYEQVGTELLSHDQGKLGKTPLRILRIAKFIDQFANGKTSIRTLLDGISITNQTFSVLKTLVDLLREIKGDSIAEYVHTMFEICKRQDSINEYEQFIKTIVESNSYKDFQDDLFQELFPNVDYDDMEAITKAQTTLKALLDVSIEEVRKWYNYIVEKQGKDVVYHTYHSTKGREFDDVVIIMENDFGALNKDKFSKFFREMNETANAPHGGENMNFVNTRNLLYVACSRAKRRLSILYLDDTKDFNENIVKTFGMNESFPST